MALFFERASLFPCNPKVSPLLLWLMAALQDTLGRLPSWEWEYPTEMCFPIILLDLCSDLHHPTTLQGHQLLPDGSSYLPAVGVLNSPFRVWGTGCGPCTRPSGSRVPLCGQTGRWRRRGWTPWSKRTQPSPGRWSCGERGPTGWSAGRSTVKPGRNKTANSKKN